MRWKAIEEQYVLGLIVSSLTSTAESGSNAVLVEVRAKMLLAAMAEAGLAVAAARDQQAAADHAQTQIMRMTESVR